MLLIYCIQYSLIVLSLVAPDYQSTLNKSVDELSHKVSTSCLTICRRIVPKMCRRFVLSTSGLDSVCTTLDEDGVAEYASTDVPAHLISVRSKRSKGNSLIKSVHVLFAWLPPFFMIFVNKYGVLVPQKSVEGNCSFDF